MVMNYNQFGGQQGSRRSLLQYLKFLCFQEELQAVVKSPFCPNFLLPYFFSSSLILTILQTRSTHNRLPLKPGSIKELGQCSTLQIIRVASQLLLTKHILSIMGSIQSLPDGQSLQILRLKQILCCQNQVHLNKYQFLIQSIEMSICIDFCGKTKRKNLRPEGKLVEKNPELSIIAVDKDSEVIKKNILNQLKYVVIRIADKPTTRPPKGIDINFQM